MLRLAGGRSISIGSKSMIRNRLTVAPLLAVILASGQVTADDFFIQKGMDAKTSAKVNRTIADHYAGDDVKRLSPSSVTDATNGNGKVECQQGVIEQSGTGQQRTGDIVLLNPTNVCINR